MRTVSSQSPPRDVRAEDLSARGRIVAAATGLFGERGFRATTVRAIAERAGVSAALVTHHFGSKEALRRECDGRIADLLDRKRHRRDSPAAILDEALSGYGPYLARMLGDEEPSSQALFRRLTEVATAAIEEGAANGQLRTSTDRDAQAVAMVVLGMAPFFVLHHLAAWAGSPAQGLARIAAPIAEIYTQGLVADGFLQQASATLAPATSQTEAS